LSGWEKADNHDIKADRNVYPAGLIIAPSLVGGAAWTLLLSCFKIRAYGKNLVGYFG
jgi:hypothetical protein